MAQTSTNQVTTKKRKNFLTYPYDYYAGQMARIFFGHIWVDDIVTIQYALNQNKMPVYGYASQQFDAVARGQIIVNGNFTIAFKETGYLNIINNYLVENKGKTKSKSDTLKYWLGKNKPIEQVLDELYMRSEGQSDFEDLAESLEDYVWDDFSEKQHRKITRPDEFDYNGNFGIDRDGFDIVLTFGDYTDDSAEHTVKVINDVHITEENMIVTPDGSPVAVNYTFFGRGLDEKISNIYNIPKLKIEEGIGGDDEINNRLDAEYATKFDVTILQAIDNEVNSISSLTGRDFYNWISLAPPYNLTDQLFTTNTNDADALKKLRSNIKRELLDRMNNLDIETWQGGYYEDLSIIKLDIRLSIEGVRHDISLKDEENKFGATIEGEFSTRTLTPVQFKYFNGKWSDFSDDDEYNMKQHGVSDPNDLPRYSKINAQGQVEKYSQNQLEAEIKASANLDKLKMIYNESE